MRIEAARLEGRELILTLTGPGQEARSLVYHFRPGDYELAKKTKKRSKDANAYLWTLCDKIAQAVGITKEEVYREAVLDYGQFIECSVSGNDSRRFIKQWKSQGIGYQTQIVGAVGNSIIIHAYYGSHLYDTAQMARLINGVIEEARGMDIETMPEEELQSLLSSWQ